MLLILARRLRVVVVVVGRGGGGGTLPEGTVELVGRNKVIRDDEITHPQTLRFGKTNTKKNDTRGVCVCVWNRRTSVDWRKLPASLARRFSFFMASRRR